VASTAVIDRRRRIAEFDVREVTAPSIDVAPDGRRIVLDILGHIYTLGINGGVAHAVSSGMAWDTEPRVSPDGAQIVFVSDRDGGGRNLWVMRADGRDIRQLTHETFAAYHSPVWMRDGHSVVVHRQFLSDTGEVDELWRVSAGTGTGVRIATSRPYTIAPTTALATEDVYYCAAGAFRKYWQIDKIQLGDQAIAPSTEVTGDSLASSFAPRLSPDGRYLAFVRRADTTMTLWLRQLADGAERALLTHLGPPAAGWRATEIAVPSYAFLPGSGELIVAWDGHLARVDLRTGTRHQLPFRAHIRRPLAASYRVPRRVGTGPVPVTTWRWPAVAPDGRQAVFSAIGRLWTTAVSGDRPRPLANTGGRQYMPSFSADSRWLAFVTWADDSASSVVIASRDGTDARWLTTTRAVYANPAWSPDGSRLVFARAPLSLDHRPDDNRIELVWISRDGGPEHVITTAQTIGYRNYPVPVFSADGQRVLFMQPDGTGAALLSVRLDGTHRTLRLRLRTPPMELIPTSDERTVALVWREQVWVAPVPPDTADVLDLDLNAARSSAFRVSSLGGIHVGWQGPEIVTWASADGVYRYDLADHTTRRLAIASFTVPRPVPSGTIAFVNARVIPEGGPVLERGTIVIRNDRIVAVGPAARVPVPSSAHVFSGEGLTVMPGLIDVHDHIHLGDPEQTPERLWKSAADLAYGVTTSYDPSARTADVFTEAEMTAAGTLLGPRVYSSGQVIRGIRRIEMEFLDIATLEDARAIVRHRARAGAIMVKEYLQPRRDQRQWLVQAAREQGVLITAEGASDMALDLSMAVDGYPAFEHALPGPLYEDVTTLLRRTQTSYTPTLLANGYTISPIPRNYVTDTGVLSSFGNPKAYFLALYWSGQQTTYMHLARGIPLAPCSTSGGAEFDPATHFPGAPSAAKTLADAGVSIAVGAHGECPGLGTHWELWTLRMGGMSNEEALEAGTINGARKIGLSGDLGSIERGKLADLVVLTANPLERIENTTKIRYVVQGGVVYAADSLKQIWPTPD